MWQIENIEVHRRIKSKIFIEIFLEWAAYDKVMSLWTGVIPNAGERKL